MNKWYLGTGLAGLLFCLIAYIPAPLVYQWLRDDWGTQVQIYGTGGNLWRGRAARVNLGGLELRSVEWRWRPQALLIGRISRSLTAQTTSGSLQAIVSNPLLGNTLYVSHMRGNLPVGQMGQGLGFPVLPFSGELQLDLDRLKVKNGKPWLAEGAGHLNNLNFSFTTPAVALGSYRAELNTQNKVILLTIGTTGGHLEVSGNGQVSREGLYELDLQLRPRATAPASVASLLQALGKPNAEGVYQFKRSGSF